MAPAFEKKELFSPTLAGKETEGKAQICFLDPEFGARFKGFQRWIFLDSGPLAFDRVLVFRFPSWPCPLAVKGSQVSLVSGVHKCYS